MFGIQDNSGNNVQINCQVAVIGDGTNILTSSETQGINLIINYK